MGSIHGLRSERQMGLLASLMPQAAPVTKKQLERLEGM
jgi:hypothetical protein